MTSGTFPLTPSLGEARRLAAAYPLIPVMHTYLDDLETPVSAFLKLRPTTGAFVLESKEHGQHFGRYSFLGVVTRETVTLRGDELLITPAPGRPTVEVGALPAPGPRRFSLAAEGGDPFAFLARHVSQGEVAPLAELPPFVGGAVGFFGYDAVRHVEHLPAPPPDDLGLPDMVFVVPEVVIAFDHLRHALTLSTTIHRDQEPDLDAAYAAASARLAAVRERLAQPLPPALESAPPAAATTPGDGVTSTFTREGFVGAVNRAKEYIAAGDVFQVVVSQRFSRPVAASGFSIYRGLRAVNPSPYMYYLSLPGFEIVGASPEPLVKVEGGVAEARPVAGTRPRGRTPGEDARLADELLADEKERAEHLMLVDLGRNDLGRVCVAGSVRVPEFMGIERFSHVMHLVSTVTGVPAEGVSASDVLRAAFPAGTVTGAPKIRAMQIIDELEPTRRGPYAGAVGYLSYSGALDSCIHIRTIIVRDGVAYVQAGAGVVADSEPQQEYLETQNKARALFAAIEVAEAQAEWE
jgi:anthranilate synthase component I